MNHLALAVSDRERSRRLYETYAGFGAEAAREYDGGVLMLYTADGFSLALGRPRSRSPSRGSGSVVEAAWEPHLR